MNIFKGQLFYSELIDFHPIKKHGKVLFELDTFD